jgi:hypothetical protein
LFFNWQLAGLVFGTRFITQTVIYLSCAKKLNEKDLWPWFLLMDLWMFFYYLLFLWPLIRRPQATWK